VLTQLKIGEMVKQQNKFFYFIDVQAAYDSVIKEIMRDIVERRFRTVMT
jgi:hypothetical protein